MPDGVEPTEEIDPQAFGEPPEVEEALPPGYRKIIKPPLIPRSEWKDVWPGSELDWSAQYIPIQLYLELPFWLMMPEGTFDVKYEEATHRISVVHGCIEIQLSFNHLKTRANTIFIARPKEELPEHMKKLLEENQTGYTTHIHRTTLIIETTILESVLKSRTGKELEQSHAISYISAMAIGHLPLVNKLLTAYRRAGNDPFVRQITESDASIWFLRLNDRFLRISIYPYADYEYRPEFPISDKVIGPADLVSSEEMVEFLDLKETPGETILLDAWNYFYSGRFDDSIRGLVTALEVLLEAKYSDALKSNGSSDEVVRSALNKTATKFTTRLNNYLQLANRTIPGPLLSWVPYITGTMLRGEMNRTRNLRHKIVHEGLIVHPEARGPMLRSVETMTYLFDWLEEDERSSRNRFKFYPLKGILRGEITFGTESTANGIRVLERVHETPTEDDREYMADDQQWGKHGRALYGEQKDFPLFAKISLACILANSSNIMLVLGGSIPTILNDHEILSPLPSVVSERFRLIVDGLACAVFLLEIDGELGPSDLTGIMVRLLQIRIELEGKRIHGICIVNHQQHLAPVLRDSLKKLSDEMTSLLISCDISLLFAADLARYIRCARDKNWPLTPLRDGLKSSGYVSCFPPASVFAGEVVKVFPRAGVLGVSVDSEVPMASGDRILVRSGVGFEAMTVESIEVERSPVATLKKGIGTLKVVGDVKLIIEGAFVFRQSPPVPAPEPIPDPASDPVPSPLPPTDPS